MVATGFANSFTSGEISDDAWDRVDLQPIAKGCEEATNLVVRIAGPLAKRRGFWRLGAVADQEKRGRMIPFRRSIDDALMLEFGDETVLVWNNDGTRLMDGSDQVQFVSPYTLAQLDGLRPKQIADVIYFRHRDGLAPQTLQRIDNTTWLFTLETFAGGPWRPENADDAFTISADHITGAVTLTASKALFVPEMETGTFKLRAQISSIGVLSWSPAYDIKIPYELSISNGRVYRATSDIASAATGTNPPVHDRGTASDGTMDWEYLHDGAGIVRIDNVLDEFTAEATVLRMLPTDGVLDTSDGGTPRRRLNLSDDPVFVATPFWAECAYSDYRGWPRMLPASREERIVDGATAANLDMLDLTATAGFTPTSQNFKPGLGTGLVVDTDAVRRRLGDDGGEIIWAEVATYLLCGTASGEHLVAGSVLDEPISPASVIVKQLSSFGSADVRPARAHKGLLYVTRGGQSLRELVVGADQAAGTEDLTVLQKHIGERGLAQLAWVPQPDEALWARLADGGLAVMTYHSEQQVRGWTRQALPGGFLVEDMQVLPGPGRQETLWMQISRTKDGGTQRFLVQQSQVSEALFVDIAEFYEGAEVTTVDGLEHYIGETVRGLADGSQFDAVVDGDGKVALPRAASDVVVGLAMPTRFKSLSLDIQGLGGTLGLRERVAAIIINIKTALAKVGAVDEDDKGLLETLSPRKASDIIPAKLRRKRKEVSAGTDTSRDTRIVVEDDSAYDCVIYSLKPKVVIGG